MARSFALALVVLSLPLVGCASTGSLASGAGGGGSGGSPLAGSPDYGTQVDSHVSSASRDVGASRETSSRAFQTTREPDVHIRIMCRNCR